MSTKIEKEQALSIMMLLSAVESWSHSVKTPLPDYLYEQIDVLGDEMRRIVIADDFE